MLAPAGIRSHGSSKSGSPCGTGPTTAWGAPNVFFVPCSDRRIFSRMASGIFKNGQRKLANICMIFKERYKKYVRRAQEDDSFVRVGIGCKVAFSQHGRAILRRGLLVSRAKSRVRHDNARRLMYTLPNEPVHRQVVVTGIGRRTTHRYPFGPIGNIWCMVKQHTCII